MFLLHIKKNKVKHNKVFKIIHLKVIIRKLQKQIIFLEKLKFYHKIKRLRLLLSKTNNFKFKKLVKYIIGILFTKTNVIIYLSDNKGNIKYICSSGFLGIKKNQRKQKLFILSKLIKVLIFKTKSILKQDLLISLHLKNFNHFLSKYVSSFLSKFYKLAFIRIENNQPHNGCRPKKIKRKKRRKLFF